MPTIQGAGQEWVNTLREFYSDSGCIRLWEEGGSGISQVVLIRHGEPDLDKKGWRNRSQAILFFSAYDSAGVIPFTEPPVCVGDLTGPVIYHSTVNRAQVTAEMIFGDRYEMQASDRFREFERKVMKFCNIRMPLKCWTVNSRLLWFIGLNDKGIENSREAKKRARENAAFLADQSSPGAPVILVAHGLHNRYVRKYLKKLGWKPVYDNGNGYLSVKVLARKGGI